MKGWGSARCLRAVVPALPQYTWQRGKGVVVRRACLTRVCVAEEISGAGKVSAVKAIHGDLWKLLYFAGEGAHGARWALSKSSWHRRAPPARHRLAAGHLAARGRDMKKKIGGTRLTSGDHWKMSTLRTNHEKLPRQNDTFIIFTSIHTCLYIYKHRKIHVNIFPYIYMYTGICAHIYTYIKIKVL